MGRSTRGLDWLKQHPKDLATTAYLAASAGQHKRDRVAAQLYATLLAERPQDAFLLNNLAMATSSFDPARALVLAQQAQQLAPDNPAIMDTLGWIQVSQAASAEQMRSGLAWLDKARAKAPDNLDIAYHYAMALLKSGDRLAARMALSDLLAQNRHFAEEAEARRLLDTLGR
jgi:thioredoxin-like negative regulator of GroEL